ncbi:hypothetical protein [uncultured Clostridium sp.]|uniref:hypothetical protein n=1 Tax=uncultured Clostridium sp. TaxID=59620 RepID=UPI00262B3D59|nr:hypothetical protein [uncultured Clostridium sp.]MCI8310116.1 hypothetical protein [Clostridia bacterium]
MDSQSKLDSIFVSYNKILKRLKENNIKTKNNKEITHKDLRLAISTMLKKHPNCRWQSNKCRNKKYFIIDEGYLWIRYVYFQDEKSLIDADIDFFEERIKQYEKLLDLKSRNLFDKEMYVKELEEFFNRSTPTIKRSVYKMLKVDSNYRYNKDGKFVITKEGVEWLCKNCFKQKYLEILENYKMELTEKYIAAGYIYDNFFNRN